MGLAQPPQKGSVFCLGIALGSAVSYLLKY
jgi:hypothetical protein